MVQVLHEKFHNNPYNDTSEILGTYDWSLGDFMKMALNTDHVISLANSEIEWDIQGNGEWVEVWRII